MQLLTCDLCSFEGLLTVYSPGQEPLARYGLTATARAAADAKRLRIQILWCPACNFAFNGEFEAGDVQYHSGTILEASDFSTAYSNFQRGRAEDLVDWIGGGIDRVVEIGAGSGAFISRIAADKKLAFEPSDEADLIPNSVATVKDYFRADRIEEHCELVVLRQVLEHIPQPRTFLKGVSEACDSDPTKPHYLYLEVPNGEISLSQGRFQDIYYEHCNYFSANSLSRMAFQLGLQVRIMEQAMGGELICVLLERPGEPARVAAKIGRNLEEKPSLFRDAISKLEPGMVLGWGASGNGTVVVNRLGISTDEMPYVIDSDPRKQGSFIPGGGQEVISPEDAGKLSPSAVVVFSQLHKDEIARQCLQIFGAGVQILVL